MQTESDQKYNFSRNKKKYIDHRLDEEHTQNLRQYI